MTIKKILIIDDQPLVVRVLTSMLHRINSYEIYSPKQGEDITELMERYTPDVIFTDIFMTDYDAHCILESARRIVPNASVIFMSGYPYDNVKDKVIAAGADYFLQKPFRSGDLVKALETVFNPSGDLEGNL